MIDADTYCGAEEINPTVMAGTEELNFLSETGTYNRDNVPCVNFSVSEEFLSNIDDLSNKRVREESKDDQN